jgi:hypothetical protein
MALRGNLRDFSLPDVFQLVTFSRKTGVLRIEREDGAHGSVWFRDGDVFFASSNWHSEPLGERLVRSNRITPQALKRALEARAKEASDGRRLGRILVEEGYITEGVLETFVSEQIQDTIFDLMRWEEGEFDFEPMPEVVEEDIGLTVSIENVVMEGSRRLEEWGRIKKKIPSTDVVFKMATAPGEGTFEISLKPMEWQLLLLIDGTRSVAELATATARTDFEVARIIYGLFSAGLLEFATEEEIERNRTERADRETKLAAIEAERAVARQAQEQAALDREARLAAETAQRRATQEAIGMPPVAPVAQIEQAPVEDPTFLGQSTSAPSMDDQAVLDEFMGAILQAPAADLPPAQEAPASPRQPYVPVEEPAFISVDHGEETDESFVPVPSVEDLLPGIATAAPAAVDALDQVVSSFDVPLVGEPAAPIDAPAIEAGPEPEISASSGFERDLLALGLGEMPADLLEPVAAEPMSEIPAAPWVDEPVLSAESPVAAAPEPLIQGEPDFAELLESLDVDADLSAPEPVAEGFDIDLILEEEPETGGVISTDAYLEDIGMDELGFTGGLTDELSALTGAERRQPARPQASVNAIPEAGSILQRDARVDKGTVLKIIEGIKGL